MTYKVEVTETIGDCSITHKFEEYEDMIAWEQLSEVSYQETINSVDEEFRKGASAVPEMAEEEAEVLAQDIINELFGEEEDCTCDLGMSGDKAMDIINSGGDLKFNPESGEIEEVKPSPVMDDKHFLTGDTQFQDVMNYLVSLKEGVNKGV